MDIRDLKGWVVSRYRSMSPKARRDFWLVVLVSWVSFCISFLVTWYFGPKTVLVEDFFDGYSLTVEGVVWPVRATLLFGLVFYFGFITKLKVIAEECRSTSLPFPSSLLRTFVVSEDCRQTYLLVASLFLMFGISNFGLYRTFVCDFILHLSLVLPAWFQYQAGLNRFGLGDIAEFTGQIVSKRAIPALIGLVGFGMGYVFDGVDHAKQRKHEALLQESRLAHEAALEKLKCETDLQLKQTDLQLKQTDLQLKQTDLQLTQTKLELEKARSRGSRWWPF